MGDLDGDGYPELAACAAPLRWQGPQTVRVFSLEDDSFERDLVLERPLAEAVTDAGDWDGDGALDLFVGSDVSLFGYAAVYSGASGELLQQLDPEHPELAHWAGVREIANLGDLGGDGGDELAFGMCEPTSPGQRAAVRIHSRRGFVREHSLAASMRELRARR